MPRFFFNLQDDIYTDDQEGSELPDMAAVRARATRYALDMIAASVAERGSVSLSDSIVVTDDTGHLVCIVRFDDVITIGG